MKFRTRVKRALTPKNIAIILFIILAIGILAYFFGDTVWEFFSNPEEIKASIEQAGIFGPLVYFILQIVQIIVAPIPGDVVDTVGGAIFGWWGLPITIVGAVAGTLIVVSLSRKYGRPFVEKFFSQAQIKKFDFLFEQEGGELALFLVFLIPFLSSDVAAYLAGLTGISTRNIMIVSILGRLPMQVLTIFFGSQILDGNWTTVLIVLLIICAAAAILYVKRDWLNGLIKGENSNGDE